MDFTQVCAHLAEMLRLQKALPVWHLIGRAHQSGTSAGRAEQNLFGDRLGFGIRDEIFDLRPTEC